MHRLSAGALCFIVLVTICACSLSKKPTANPNSNQPSQSANQQPATAPQNSPSQTKGGELQPGQASGTYTAKGEVVELKYAYAGRAQRFGTESLVILLTDKPIPPDAVAEEIKSTTLLEGDQIRGLEYAIDDNGMWVRYHPSQYQESGTNKIKEYKIEGDVVRGIDENDGGLSDGKYARSVKFVAAIVK